MTSVLKKPRAVKSCSAAVPEVAPTLSPEDSAKLLKYIDDNVIGKETSFCGPFGRRKVVYCDYNGSGRALHFLEDHMTRDVLPAHATQCTAMSHTSLQSSLYRSEARRYVLSSVGGGEEDAVVLGASPTRLLRALRPERPAVFVSARVPERQLAPWRECDAEARRYVLSSVGGGEEDAVVLGASPTRLLRALRPERPAVFVSARVPERQLAPWRECDAEARRYVLSSVGGGEEDAVVLGASPTRLLRALCPERPAVFVSARVPERQLAPWRECDAEARRYVLSSVGGGEEDAVVLGASPTRLLRALRPERPAVFVSARVPERQLAPWRECVAEIIKIPETKEGFIDLNSLEQRLREKSGSGRKMIGFFAAASKLTGVLADDVATTLLLHQYGAWAFWDYTLVAPSAAVHMNPTLPGCEERAVMKDALFFNCEKFVGGVQAPFVAVVKREVFRNTPLYTDDLEALAERVEECGAAEAARATLVLQLRDAVGLQQLAMKQDRITRQVIAHIKNIPELILLGSESPTVRRLPIFSLLVKHPRGTFLHHNFVCAVLNDVFGVQARGGLSGNLSYGQDVLGIDAQLLREYEKLLNGDLTKAMPQPEKSTDRKPFTPNEHLRPGFSRISLPFFMSESELAFVLEALKMVATEGWKILPQYVVNPENGQWRHHSNAVFRDRKSLFSIRYHDGKMTSHERRISGPGIFPQTYTECLQTARNLFNRARKLAMKCSVADQEVTFNPRMDYLRWFMLPKEAHDLLLGKSGNVKHIVPFDPSGYTGARRSLIQSGSNASSPILSSSPRHYSLSAIDDCALIRLKQKTKFFSRESSLMEKDGEYTNASTKTPPVQFAVGESIIPIHLRSNPVMMRSRCYSLGSDVPSPNLSPKTRLNLGLSDISATETKNSLCNCGSQTDLQSLDDPMLSPTRVFPYSTQSSASISDCSVAGRASPTISIASHTSEDLHAYVKEMTREIATELKSEIREVISQVDDILENSDSVEQSNASMISNISNVDNNSVSVIDVAEYLMGMSREMASEVKHEIREMVNQVDGMMSPDMLNMCSSGSRRGSPPQAIRRRLGSGPELGLNLKTACANSASLKKCPTSPILPSQMSIEEDESVCCSRSFETPPKSKQGTPLHEASGPTSLSFNSSETSTPDTIIQVVSTSLDSPTMPKSLSTHKLSDDEACCSDAVCRQYCNKKNWCQNPSISSQDSGINMSFTEADSYQDFVKWRTCSDPTHKGRRAQSKLKSHQRYEKTEVPDIIEGVPVCSGDYSRQYRPCCGGNTTDIGRVDFQLAEDIDSKDSRSSLCQPGAAGCGRSPVHSELAPCSRYTDAQRTSQDLSPPFDEIRKPEFYQREESGSGSDGENEEGEGGGAGAGGRRASASSSGSARSDSSAPESAADGDWRPPTRSVWKGTLEAIHEYDMIRDQDKVLVCLSGSRDSLALLHTLHHYQLYARGRGVHFTMGAIFVNGPESDIDPLHLMAYCRNLGVKFIYQDKTDEDQVAPRGRREGAAHRWARHGVRRRVYAAAAAHGYGVAALAQHLDRAARAFLAAAFHGGALRTTRAHYYVREHNLRIVRPFVYVRESELRAFAVSSRLPEFVAGRERSPRHDDCCCDAGKSSVVRDRSASEPCGRAAAAAAGGAGERTRTRSEPGAAARDLLASHERLYPCLFTSLKSALHPLISAKSIDQDLKEHRQRKKSVIQMKNGAPVYDSEEGTDEEPVP